MRSVRRMLSLTAVLSMLLLGIALAEPAHAVAIECGTIIDTPNTTFLLSEDVDCINHPGGFAFGVAIVADNVTLDLNGHAVRGPSNPSAWDQGIYVTSVLGPADGVTVKNGGVTGFPLGLNLEEVNRGKVTNMNLHDNIGPDQIGALGGGLRISGGGSHVIQGNRMIHNGPFAGIEMQSSSGNLISGNQIARNDLPDVVDGTPIRRDVGISLLGASTVNTIRGNQVDRSGSDGIRLSSGVNGNVVLSNSVSKNGGGGIILFGSANTVQANVVMDNTGNGIAVRLTGQEGEGRNNVIRFNRALGNGSVDTDSFDARDDNLLPPCDNNVWSRNVFGTKSQTCIQ